MRRAIASCLRRPSRIPRALRAALALVLGALAIIGLAAPASSGQSSDQAVAGAQRTKSPFAPGPGDPTKSFPTSPALKAQGAQLYQDDCASCHGAALHGTPGVAPSLIGVGAGPVHFYLSTGRMPLASPREQPQRNASLYNARQIDALIDYVSSFGGPPAPTADASNGDLAVGLHQFTLSCAGCHQIVARGGPTLGAVAPSLQDSTPQQIAEAVRMGPYLMPRFSPRQIDQHQLDSLARYILWTRKPDNAGGWGIYNIGPIPEGIVAWFLALAALVIVARLIGERTA
ncbi:MAG TPA: c-type cytochrome [Solirubrobacteraceae bacterium]|nr:c-type cytochrome [Solirubrobacteraceae bacterium]